MKLIIAILLAFSLSNTYADESVLLKYNETVYMQHINKICESGVAKKPYKNIDEACKNYHKHMALFYSVRNKVHTACASNPNDDICKNWRSELLKEIK